MNESDIFKAAVKLSTAERTKLLDLLCKDQPELRKQVDALIKAHFDSATFLHESAFENEDRHIVDVSQPADSRVAVGMIIAGRYKLLQAIGEGGMGSVWLAEQAAPVKRKVAIKLIKAGMDSRQVLSRFEAERTALSLMDHPNIARILDGGMTEAGSPFFVMELVKGTPITEFCDARKMTPKERLELFVPVCQAIQHAHQKGIIHRDIKPSNVLVALYDDLPVPKVIDFGVAKATGQALTEQTLNTGFTVVGTPQYMSPEQATFNQLDIDTRSDIYSLGVLLYELLVGSPPFNRKELEKAGLIEILRVIREEEPPRPSTKASTADGLPSISINRGTEPKKLTGMLRNELDWIVMKALEKNRVRRYETANGFAADINRYLAGETVLAHPPSRTYRVRKFLRKYKGPVLGTSLVFCTLLAGIIGTTYGLFQAIEQRVIAQQAENETIFAYQESTNNVVKNLFRFNAELSQNETAFLENNLKNWESFANHQWDPKRKLAIRARGYTNVARLFQNLGQKDDARREFLKARDVLKELVAQFPNVPEYQWGLANAHNDCGIILNSIGMKKESQSEYEASCDLKATLIKRFPNEPKYQDSLAGTLSNLGGLLVETGKHEEAHEKYQASADVIKKLIDQFPDKPEFRQSLAGTFSNFVRLLVSRGMYEEAREKYQTSCEILKQLNDEVPNRSYELDLAHIHHNFGLVSSNLGKPKEALLAYQASCENWKKLVQEFPSEYIYEQHLASVCIDLANLQETLLAAPGANPTGLSKWNDDQWYDFACVFSIASRKIPDRQQLYADRAMELLNYAITAGYDDVDSIAKAPDLDPLREREDFKQLLATLYELKGAARAESPQTTDKAKQP